MNSRLLAWLQGGLRSPIYPDDEEKTALANVVQAYMFTILLLELAALPVVLILFYADSHILWILLISVTSTWLSWLAVRKGFAIPVGIATQVFFWAFTASLVLINGGMQGPYWSLFIPGTLAAGLFFSLPGAVTYALCTLAAGLVLVYLSLIGIPLPLLTPVTPTSGWLLLLLTLIGTLLPVNVHLRRLRRALADARQELAERQRIQAEVAGLNDDLEQRVRERTAELEAANREIEAYSYSVSHDLRAPIRSIVGYTQIVLATHRDQLPADAQRDLELVRQGGFQMEHLVDGLLEYLNIRNRVPVLQTLDMKALALDAWDELRFGQSDDRSIDFTVHDLPGCSADSELVKILWIKLLDNALKFTQHTQAHIEVGSMAAVQGPIYFVRDDGAGFDMRYADKIFNIFQRLHRAEDFQGAGLGLAIARRIVDYHHGRIWVKAAPSQGATFYFTLAE